MRLQVLQKLFRRNQIKLRIARFDAEKKAIARRQRKARNVENRMVRLRQAIQCKHGEYRRERGKQNRELERNWNERRPTVEGASADVQRVVDHRGVILKAKSGQTTDDAANQHEARQAIAMHVNRLSQAFNRKRRVGIQFPIAFGMRAFGRRKQVIWIFKLGHEAVDDWF